MARILIVSPDSGIRGGRRNLLGELDAEVETRADMRTAFEALRTGRESGLPYDLLIVDLEEDAAGRNALDLCAELMGSEAPPLRLLLIWPEEAERGAQALAEGKVTAILSRHDGWRQFRPTVARLLSDHLTLEIGAP